MNNMVTPEIREIINAVHYRPAISIILPFEHKMGLKESLAYTLKTISERIEQELITNYPDEVVALIMHKIKMLTQNLNVDTHKKSMAIFVSPVFEKLLYLEMPVEEKVIIDESFEIRDLVYNKKQLQEYLILQLNSNESKLYLGNSGSITRLKFNTPESIHSYDNDIPQKVANFSDMSERKEILMEKYLHHIDHSIDQVLKENNLPLFIMGTERISGHFKNLTKHQGAIIEYIHGNYDEATLPQLQELLKPYLKNWDQVKQQNLLHLIEVAAGNKILATGMKHVWEEVMNNKGRLLVVEKNYSFAAQQGSRKDIIYKTEEPYNKFSYIKDAVDDVIEKILETGGDVEFVDENLLEKYQHIALIKYY